MQDNPAFQSACARLKSIHSSIHADDELGKIITARDEVLRKYQPMFSSDNLVDLTWEQFYGFLLFKNNRHWTGLNRAGSAIEGDFVLFKEKLHFLLDEEEPITDRLDSSLDKATGHKIKGFGKGIATAILTVAYPEKYAVWNGTSEGAMIQLGVWPKFERKQSIGSRYEQINAIIGQMAGEVGVDLWVLDALFWRALDTVEASLNEQEEAINEDVQRFGLERHLHHFMRDNWDHLGLSDEWELVREGGDIDGYGCERPTSIGRIDLLAKHRNEPRWLVLELKRNQSSDDTIGQTMRYMGWVEHELAEAGETVEGLIIAHQSTKKLQYALTQTNNIRFSKYEVDFRLVEE